MCDEERDNVWFLVWPSTLSGSVSLQPCPMANTKGRHGFVADEQTLIDSWSVVKAQQVDVVFLVVGGVKWTQLPAQEKNLLPSQGQ